jgi:hypothetical protein
MQVPHISNRTTEFAKVILELVDAQGEVRIEDSELATVVAERLGQSWQVPTQAIRDALGLLERHGALTFDRRRPGRRPTDPNPELSVRTITVNRSHWLWLILAATSEVAA